MNATTDDDATFDDDEELPAEKELVLPWTYCPAQDPAICLNLVEELMHLIIILITVRIGIPVPTDAGIYFLSFSIISQNNLAHRSLPSSSQEMSP